MRSKPWQLDVVHDFLLVDGTSAKALTGIDDHSRYGVFRPADLFWCGPGHG